jgi:HemY protein|tara:strand:- start:9929 stop:11152 length:1224 start_codon:yes stop_codon:yes gene_type:complete
MKRVFIASLLILLASAALVAAIEFDPGYLLISYGHYTVESSVWIGLGVFLLFFFMIYGFFSVLRRTINGGSAVSGWLSGRGHRRSQKQTTKGIISFIEGNWRLSQRTLSRAAATSETPLLNYLIAARASHRLGDEKETRAFLKKAEESTTGASNAVGLTQAELQLSSGQFEQSLATLTRVRRNASKQPFVLHLLRQVYEGLNDWQALLALIPELKKHSVLSVEKLDDLVLEASQKSLVEAAKTRGVSASQLEKLWAQLPKAAVINSETVACYADQLIALGEMQKAEKLIRSQLKKDWDRALISRYGKVEADDVAKQLIHAENWLKERNNDAALLLCLGRISLRNALWGKAREYFENSLKLEKSAAVYGELARLLAHLGEVEKSNDYFQRGLILLPDGLIDLPMPDKK